jgi:hexosaminidase
MQVFWHEVAKVFLDNYVHVGGDEVIFDCWQSNPDITAYMTKHNYSGNYALLEQFYENSVLQIVESTGKSYSMLPVPIPPANFVLVAWEDVFDNGCKLNAQTVIEVWKDWGVGWQATIANVTANGFKSILSAPWYAAANFVAVF